MTQRLLNIIGLPSATLAQHLYNIGSTAVYVYLAHLISGPVSRLKQRGGGVTSPQSGNRGAGGMSPGNFEKTRHFGGIQGGGVQTTKNNPGYGLEYAS